MYTLDAMTSSSSSFQMSTSTGQSIQTLSALTRVLLALNPGLQATIPHVEQLKLDIFLDCPGEASPTLRSLCTYPSVSLVIFSKCHTGLLCRARICPALAACRHAQCIRRYGCMYVGGLHLQSDAHVQSWLACCIVIDECHARWHTTEQSRSFICYRTQTLLNLMGN